MVVGIIVTGKVENIIYDCLAEFVGSARYYKVPRIFSRVEENEDQNGLVACFLDPQQRIHRYASPEGRKWQGDDTKLSDMWFGQTRIEGDIYPLEEEGRTLQRFFYNDALWRTVMGSIPRQNTSRSYVEFYGTTQILVRNNGELLMAPLDGLQDTYLDGPGSPPN